VALAPDKFTPGNFTPDNLTSAAAERNKDPILNVLESVLPCSGSVLEIASGTGQHICFFAAEMPHIRWQPTEPETESRDSIVARIREAGLTNVSAPIALDVHAPRWPVDSNYDAVLCINMIHISPWSATTALCLGAARHLPETGKLVLYGPYLEQGTAAQSNLDFDASLRRRNPEWGLRALEEVTRVAAEHGLRRLQVVRMPANNLSVVFARAR
jgi:cyclopropane fatty-acyl-phospholipid synthase-like methyltransferase